MGHSCIARICSASRVGLGLVVLAISSSQAQEDPEAKKRLEFMQAAVESLEPESKELKSKPALTISSKPLLRYNDPTRGGTSRSDSFLLDAGVWRLGTEGRPTGLVTVEIYQTPDKVQLLSFEFLAMSEAKFSLKHKTKDVHWDPATSGLKPKDLPDAPKPAATAAARLTQMRQFSRRFTAKERIIKDTIECRLIAQPIDRYQSEAAKIVDGAIFALAHGTNPEIGILLETDGEHWKYGILRLTSAEVTVSLDDREVEKYENYAPPGRTDDPYHYTSFKIEPGK
jgi:hypothetical protein